MIMCIIRVYQRGPSENYPAGLTLLVENPLSRDLVLRAKRVFVKYLDEDEQEARLATYKDARKTGIGSTLAHSTNIRENIMGAHSLKEGDRFEVEIEVADDIHRFHIVKPVTQI